MPWPGDESTDGVDRKSRIDDQHIGLRRDLGNGREIPDKIIGQILVEADIDRLARRNQDQRIAIGWGFRGEFDADGAIGATVVRPRAPAGPTPRVSLCAIARDTRSVPPPGTKGTIRRIGFDGYPSAASFCASTGAIAPTQAMTIPHAATRRARDDFLFAFILWALCSWSCRRRGVLDAAHGKLGEDRLHLPIVRRHPVERAW